MHGSVRGEASQGVLLLDCLCEKGFLFIVYDGQWVYIINLRLGNGTILGGEVAAHDPDRDKVIEVMRNTPGGGIFIKYAGAIPEGVSLLL